MRSATTSTSECQQIITLGRRGDGLLGVVPRQVDSGWQHLRLHLIDDVEALWPDLVAGDHCLIGLSVGVRPAVRHCPGGRGPAAFPAQRPERRLALQARLMTQYADRYPRVRQQRASELSLVRHLNEFGGQPVLPDYPQSGPRKDDSVAAAVARVAWAQLHGGLASLLQPTEPATGILEVRRR